MNPWNSGLIKVMLIPKRIDMKYINSPRSNQHYKLHPLIHAFLGFAQAQDVEKKKSGAEAPSMFLEK